MINKIKNMFFGGKDNGTEKMRRCILVVDDNEVDRKIIQNILNKAGYRVLLAENGKIGLNIVREESPDVIVLDCDMPVMNGIDMCTQVKADEKTREIPVLFLTGSETPMNVVKCFELDAANFLQKPVYAKTLLSQIKSIFAEEK